MKIKTMFLAAAAFSCCGLSSGYAQIQINNAQPRLAPRLASAPADGEEIDSFAQEVIENPFDFFAAEAPSAAPAPGSSADADVGISPSDADPTSLPIGRRQPPSMADTIIDHATVAALPNASMAPVYWSAPAPTPNPVADVLLRQECNAAALWDGYAAQRELECAAMWNRIHGHHHRCGAASCGSCPQPVRNRYLPVQQHLSGGACDCDAAAPSVVAEPTAVMQSASPATTRDNVAFLPLLNR